MRKTIKTDTDSVTREERSTACIRPQTLHEYIGQPAARERLTIYIEAAKQRNEPLDHILFYGPPGLGKTTLAGIIANEMGVAIKTTSGPAIEKPGDLAAILCRLKEGDVLFIDEIHRLNKQVEEVLYPAMEDHALDIVIGKGPQAKSIRLELPRFTLIGATTRPGLLSAPLRDRFGESIHMDYYGVDDLTRIVLRSARVLELEMDEKSAKEIAKRSRGTPRIANNMLRRVRDFLTVRYEGTCEPEAVLEILDGLGVDGDGLNDYDRRVIQTIAFQFGGGPVGLETLAASLGEDPGTVEDLSEGYLLKRGYLLRTPRGRTLTDKGMRCARA